MSMYLFIAAFKICWYSKVNKYYLDGDRIILHTAFLILVFDLTCTNQMCI